MRVPYPADEPKRQPPLDVERKLHEILDHMRQAVLVFGSDGTVEELQSGAARRIFGDAAAGKNIRELLFDEAERWTTLAQLFDEWVGVAFGVSASDWTELAAVAPTSTTIHPQSSSQRAVSLDLEFRPIFENEAVSRLLLIATDVTELHRLAAEVTATQTRQQNELAAMRRLVGGSAQVFAEFLRTASARLERCRKVLDNPRITAATIERVLEILHTLRGEARAFDLADVAAECEELEARLKPIRVMDDAAQARWAARHSDIVELVGRGKHSIAAARSLFIEAAHGGEAALDQTTVRFSHLERLNRLVRGRGDDVERAVAVLSSRPFGECVAAIVSNVPVWSEAESRSVTVTLRGRDLPVPAGVAAVLGGVLVHLVRHTISHGLEADGERCALGKPNTGCIQLTASLDPNPEREVIITVADDGRGVDEDCFAANAALQTVRGELRAVGYDVHRSSTLGKGTRFTIAKSAVDVVSTDPTTARHERTLLALAVSGAGTLDWDLRTGIVLRGDSYLRFLGFTEEELGDGVEGWERRIHPDDRARVFERREAHLAGSVPEYDVDYRMLAKDGSWMWVRSRGRVTERDADGRAVRLVGTVSDVSAQHAKQERLLREARLRGLENRINEIELIVSRDGALVEVNDRALSAYGYTREEIVRLNIRDIRAPATRSNVPSHLERTISNSGIHFETDHCRKDGSVFPVDVSSRVFEVDGVRFMHSLVRDLTEQRRVEAERTRAEEQLRAALDERDTLLKEVHHRVKNNLQMMISLFALQADQVKDPHAVQALVDSQQRLRSIALIHEQLYQAGDVARVDFALYAKNVAGGLRTVVGAESTAAIDVDIGEALLDVHVAIPCALILNELVSNALKYAFPDGRTGRIRVGLAPADEVNGVTGAKGFALTVSDDGVGIRADLDPARATTLGLKLVHILARQLGGQVTIDRAQGTHVSVVFPQTREVDP